MGYLQISITCGGLLQSTNKLNFFPHFHYYLLGDFFIPLPTCIVCMYCVYCMHTSLLPPPLLFPNQLPSNQLLHPFVCENSLVLLCFYHQALSFSFSLCVWKVLQVKHLGFSVGSLEICCITSGRCVLKFLLVFLVIYCKVCVFRDAHLVLLVLCGKFIKKGSFFVVNILMNWSNVDGVLIFFADLWKLISMQVIINWPCFVF